MVSLHISRNPNYHYTIKYKFRIYLQILLVYSPTVRLYICSLVQKDFSLKLQLDWAKWGHVFIDKWLSVCNVGQMDQLEGIAIWFPACPEVTMSSWMLRHQTLSWWIKEPNITEDIASELTCHEESHSPEGLTEGPVTPRYTSWVRHGCYLCCVGQKRNTISPF